MIGDLAGFAAAILLRGLDYVQIPTSLLAQVDSAVGGKTGINARQGKNLIGSFHQPRLVLSDTDVLASLPARQLRAGYAEVVKYGVIDRPEFFAWLEQHGAALLAGDAAAQQHAIVESCRAKAALVAADERETGARALLNLGHTFGHALEARRGLWRRACCTARRWRSASCWRRALSVRLGLCPAADAERIRGHFAAVGLPTSRAALAGRPASRRARCIAAMAHDKKVAGRPPALRPAARHRPGLRRRRGRARRAVGPAPCRRTLIRRARRPARRARRRPPRPRARPRCC